MLRPIANPFALGLLGLAAATTVLSGHELHWIPPRQHMQMALIILLTAPALQLLASVFGFLARDAVAATGMGVLATSWAVIGAVHLASPPQGRSQALGTFLFVAGAGLVLSAITAAETKGLLALVMAVTAARFVITGVVEFVGGTDLEYVSGALGCVLAAVALYGAFAVELEGLEHRTVLPTFRRGRGREALESDLGGQIRTVAAEPGVRNQL